MNLNIILLTVSFLILRAFDLHTTYFFMTNDLGKEANDALAFIFEKIGLKMGLALNAVFSLLLAASLLKENNLLFAIIMNIMMILPPFWNWYNIQKRILNRIKKL